MDALQVEEAEDGTPVIESAWRRIRLDAHLAWRATGRGIVE
jgi:hypothetical protein